MDKGKVLVVDDEINILKVIELSLSSQGFTPEIFSNPLDALKRAQEIYFDIAFIDLKMEPIDGLQTLARLKNISPDTTTVLMTAHGSIETAVEAIKGGAYDYITKPFTHKEFIHLAERVFEHHILLKEVQGLRAQIEENYADGEIITQNFQMREILKLSKDIADSDLPVLIEGESGTGKEILARYIHANSKRSSNPFVPINCAAIPESLFESEIFGHIKGSYTGAMRDRIGRFEMGDQGTVFLDEVGEIANPMQVKLLRFLQNMEFERVGENITRKINVRIISATNRNIDDDIKSGDLREDFYYRLSGIRIKLPPLRERKEDIPHLSEYFLKKYSPENEIRLSPEALKLLNEYSWPGNIRELENMINRAIVLAKDNIVKPEYFPNEIFHTSERQFTELIPTLNDVEKSYIIEVLKNHPNPKDASQILGISLTTLWRKRKEYKI
ncbi:MAG: sigma-54 dependent transcriptional regulator [Ignavibacteriaceae bacterium]|nr:sigma-54 dependent transcriptional regulator [Ignavibacteriaceae bacterium]